MGYAVLLSRHLPAPLKDAVEVLTWKRCYTMSEVNLALSKVQLVGYSQKIVSTCLSFKLTFWERDLK